VGDLMDDVDQQEVPALKDGGDDEGEAGVLHGNDGEGGRQEYDVIPGEASLPLANPFD
jgi:hypothetical protein